MYKFSGPDHLVECTTAGGVIRRHKSSREERIEKRKKQDEARSKSPPSHFNSVCLAMDLEVPAWDFVLHTGTPCTRRFATGFPAFSYPRIVVDIVILYRLGHNMPMFTDRGAMPSFLRSGNPSLALPHLCYFCWCAPHKGSHRVRKVQFFWTLFKRGGGGSNPCSKIMLWILYNTKGPLAA